MKLLSPAISTLARLRSWRIDAWMQHPISAQREVLQDLVTAGQYTEFGRKYDFSKLFNTKTFKQAVPIHEYEDLKPYVERIKTSSGIHLSTGLQKAVVRLQTKASSSRSATKVWWTAITKQQKMCYPFIIAITQNLIYLQVKDWSLGEVILLAVCMMKLFLAT
jgi:hypothetical protein